MELSIKESCSRPQPQKPIPLKTNRQTNPPLLKKTLKDYYDERAGQIAFSQYAHEFDGIFYTPASEITLARHQIDCLDQELLHARYQWAKEKEANDKRWEKALERQSRLFKSIPNMNDYYKETYDKRERAKRSLKTETEQEVMKQREIRRYEKEVKKLLEVKHESESRLEKFWLFKSYLNRVKDTSHGEYQSIKDLIDRYAVLANARDALMGRNDGFRDTVERRQKALENDVLTKSNEVLAYRNYLSELLDYDTKLEEQVFAIQDNLIRIKTTAANRTLVIGQIKMAIANLYYQVCRSMRRNIKLRPEDTLGQLLDVRISIKEMSKLSRDMRRMLKAAHLTAKAEKLAREKLQRLNEERQKRIDRLAAKKGNVDVRALFNLPPIKNKTPDVSKVMLLQFQKQT